MCISIERSSVKIGNAARGARHPCGVCWYLPKGVILKDDFNFLMCPVGHVYGVTNHKTDLFQGFLGTFPSPFKSLTREPTSRESVCRRSVGV